MATSAHASLAPPSESILIIDDEPQIRRVVRNAVADATGRVREAATASDGIDIAAAERPSLIILDLGLPDRDGGDVCRDLRAFTSVPIIVLSARHSEREMEKLLDAGADDYITKPFSTVELKARVRVQLRRAARNASGKHDDGLVAARGLSIDLVRRTVRNAGGEIHLTPTEWNLLRVFIAHAGQTLTHRQLFAAVWGDATGDAQQYLRVYIGQLRCKLEHDPIRPKLIRTEPSVGYRLELDA